MITFIDFETHDPLLKKYGSGAIFKYHYPEIDFQILVAGVKNDNEKGYIDFINDSQAKDKFSKILKQATVIVMHNALYDLACIKYIYKECKDIEKYLPIIQDTMLMAKLVYQQEKSYSLDHLAKKYECVAEKQSNLLHDYAWDSGLYRSEHFKNTKRSCHKRPSEAVIEKFCKTNMRLFPTDVIGAYCLCDVDATENLYFQLMPLLKEYALTDVSKILKICLKAKFRGVRLDLIATKRLSMQWKELAKQAKDSFLKAIGKIDDGIFNINSGAQLGPELEKLGIEVPKTLLGNYSIDKDWLEEQGHPVLKELQLYRKANKAEKDFIQKILQYQDIIPDKYKKENIGIMFPSLKPLGATLTGRFTSGGGTGSLELNILAISGRDEHFGLPIRELFLPYHEDEKIICADFSNQEPRLQVHYAALLNCNGVSDIVAAWNENPKMKYHQKVADLTKLAYDIAKMVTLGLSYGMGVAKLAVRLNMAFVKAKKLVGQYHTLLPFMKQLQQAAAKGLKNNGYIKTIGGRKLTIDPAYEFKGQMRTSEHKAMSKLIQGSGLDQLWKAMIAIDDAGLSFMLCVHDEVIISSKQPEVEKDVLVGCMENAYKLVVPVVAEAGIGDNWLQAKPK